MRVRCGAGNDFAEENRKRDAIEVGVFSLRVFRLIYTQAGEPCLEDFVERELYGDVREAKEGRGEAGIEGEYTLVFVHLAKGVEGVIIVPWGSIVSGCASSVGLGHQTSFNDPDGVRDHCRAGSTGQGGVDVGKEFVICTCGINILTSAFGLSKAELHLSWSCNTSEFYYRLSSKPPK